MYLNIFMVESTDQKQSFEERVDFVKNETKKKKKE